MIAGGLFNLEDPRDYFQLPVIVNTVLDAVDSFNASNVSTIKKIGFWSKDLCVPRIDPIEAGKILKSLYGARYPKDRE